MIKDRKRYSKRTCLQCGGTKTYLITVKNRIYENWIIIRDRLGIKGYVCKKCWNRLVYIPRYKARKRRERELQGKLPYSPRNPRRKRLIEHDKNTTYKTSYLVGYHCTVCKHHILPLPLPNCYIAREHEALTGHKVIREKYRVSRIYNLNGELVEEIDWRTRPELPILGCVSNAWPVIAG